jgi:hypothetical protein
VTAPVFLNGVPVLASGTQVLGNTADASSYRAASDGTAEQSATLRLQFNRIVGASGRAEPLFSVVEGIDNARESVSDNGLITGIQPSQTAEAKIDQGINKLGSQYGQLAQILSGVEGTLVKPVDPSIAFKPGVELTLRLTRPLLWTSPAFSGIPGAIAPSATLQLLVNDEPFQTTAQKPPKPSDLINLMFIGSEEQIANAFQRAGWFPADVLSRTSKLETARALIEDRGYSEAPMSILLVDGRPPDIALQKQNDTFAMRHHIRIWRMPQMFNGQPVWIAAATHDISITFSAASRSFTHKIDSHIDLERAKVVNDLLFASVVRALALVDRTGPQEASNATGDKVITDGKIAVVEF